MRLILQLFIISQDLFAALHEPLLQTEAASSSVIALLIAPFFSLRPPQYSSAGCLLTLHHSEKPDHEEVCEFRPYTCPCPGATCKWHGSLEAVMPHLMHAHKSITTLQVSADSPTWPTLYSAPSAHPNKYKKCLSKVCDATKVTDGSYQ